MAEWTQKDGYWYNPAGNSRYQANPYTVVNSFGGENDAQTNYAPILGSLQDLDPMTGQWATFQGVPHQEEFGYQLRARELPDWQQSFNDLKAGTADKWDFALRDTPGAWGQANVREDLSQFSPLGGTEVDRRNTFLIQTGADKQFGLGFAPQQHRIAQAQIASSTPQAQAARDKDGLGDLAPFVGLGLNFAFPGLGAALGGSLGLGSGLLANAVGSGLIGGLTSAVSGGDFGKGLLSGGLGSLAGGVVGGALKGADLPSWVSRGLSGAASGAVRSAIGGGNVGQGLLLGGLGSAVGGGVSEALKDTGLPSWVSSGLSGLATGVVRNALTDKPSPRPASRPAAIRRPAPQPVRRVSTPPAGARKVGNIFGRA